MQLEIDIHKMAQEVATRALDEAAYKGRTMREWIELIRRLGEFGELFTDYKGCPRGAMGRACMPIEEEVLQMKPITDVDGGRWIPVNADALHELVKKYVSLRDGGTRPIVHARWKIGCDTHVDYYGEVDEEFFIECPLCGRREYDINSFKAMSGNYEETTKGYPYCHCGARMDGDPHDGSGQ